MPLLIKLSSQFATILMADDILSHMLIYLMRFPQTRSSVLLSWTIVSDVVFLF